MTLRFLWDQICVLTELNRCFVKRNIYFKFNQMQTFDNTSTCSNTFCKCLAKDVYLLCGQVLCFCFCFCCLHFSCHWQQMSNASKEAAESHRTQNQIFKYCFLRRFPIISIFYCNEKNLSFNAMHLSCNLDNLQLHFDRLNSNIIFGNNF